MPDLTLAAYVESSREAALARLVDWVKIPSISADPAHAPDVEGSAHYCAQLLRDAGLDNVEVCPITEDRAGPGEPASVPGGGPVVYGEWLGAGPGAPTVLIYGHHDVQPVDPLDEWQFEPFAPTVAGGQLQGRGTSDDKGQVLMQIEAVRGLLAERGTLPVNVKFLVEGEEEVGSPHLEPWLGGQKDRLAADVIVVSDTTMHSLQVPSTTVGMRGLVAFDVKLRTARSDLHSGIWGGTVPNAAIAASRLASALHDATGRVTIPGFYDDVAEVNDGEPPFDEADFCQKAGVNYLEGESGRTPYERTATRPTAELVGIHSGYGGPGIKTIVPATANLKLAVRLVPHQQPEDIAPAIEAWLVEHLPVGIDWSVSTIGGVAPLLTPVSHPAMAALSRAIESVWGKGPIYTRSGGSGPEEALSRVLEAPLICLGVGLPEDNFHAPNERLVLDQLWRGVVAAGELLVELGRVGKEALT